MENVDYTLLIEKKIKNYMVGLLYFKLFDERWFTLYNNL